jgi:ketosteroid isomerase-like protein
MHRHAMLSLLVCVLAASSLLAQSSPVLGGAAPGLDGFGQTTGQTSNPLVQPTLSPGILLLLELDGRLTQAVAAGGGKAFGTWFAEDAVTLNNGRPAIFGHAAIAAQAQWDPKQYQLAWTPQGAQMGPSNDMGFTWGHYEGHSRDKNGEPLVVSGRYVTVWKKAADGNWKISLEASANDAPAVGECCTLPKP